MILPSVVFVVAKLLLMIAQNLLVWNVRGLNSRARRNVVRELVAQERISLISLQETKLDVCNDALVTEMLGYGFDYVTLPAIQTCGGIALAWRRDIWSMSNYILRANSITAKCALLGTEESWWITCVYGPQHDAAKIEFLQELRDLRSGCPGPWVVCGDFNLIYQAADKNNGRLNRRMMNRFRQLLDDLELMELHLHGRLFTWSNERADPTLERIDRVFVSEDWSSAFPNHNLRALSSQCSDHAPLLLRTDCSLRAFLRFRFENIWPSFEGYLGAVQEAWNEPCPVADAFRTLDIKLRRTAAALKRWSGRRIGSIRLQLAIAKEIVLRLDMAQETHSLSDAQRTLRNRMKAKCLGLASLQRTIARQRSRITFLAEGDTNTKFFHLQACHRSRKNNIESIRVGDDVAVHDEAMAQAFFDHYDSTLGTHSPRTSSLNFELLDIPHIDLSSTDYCFSEEEIWRTVLDMPVDKAPGPDGFTGLFYRTAWPIIKHDIMRAFQALWLLDGRSFYLVNQAYMILLRKKDEATLVTDFRPISLIHSFSKLFTKVLANRIARRFISWSGRTRARSSRGAFCTTISGRSTLRPSVYTGRRCHVLSLSSTLPKLSILSTGHSCLISCITWDSQIDGSIGLACCWQRLVQGLCSMDVPGDASVMRGASGRETHCRQCFLC